MTAHSLSNIVVWLFVASWLASALWAGRTADRSPWRGQAPLYAAVGLYVVLLAAAAWGVPAMRVRLWQPQVAFDAVMLLLQAAGIAWCWWARVRIGRLWSGGIVVKEGHRVVDTGPYAAVRHPIYSGAFLLIAAHVLVKARPVDLLFCAGFIAFFTVKARIEEGFLRAQLGDDYTRYGERVPMLVPSLRGLRAAWVDRRGTSPVTEVPRTIGE